MPRPQLDRRTTAPQFRTQQRPSLLRARTDAARADSDTDTDADTELSEHESDQRGRDYFCRKTPAEAPSRLQQRRHAPGLRLNNLRDHHGGSNGFRSPPRTAPVGLAAPMASVAPRSARSSPGPRAREDYFDIPLPASRASTRAQTPRVNSPKTPKIRVVLPSDTETDSEPVRRSGARNNPMPPPKKGFWRKVYEGAGAVLGIIYNVVVVILDILMLIAAFKKPASAT